MHVMINHDHNMPCTLCLAVGRSTMVMIPSHYECPAEWYKEYDGYIMRKYCVQCTTVLIKTWSRYQHIKQDMKRTQSM